MYLEIGIQSVSDIITNSSSEIFSVRSDLSKSELLSLLNGVNSKFRYNGDWYKLPKEEQVKYDHSTGMGGILEIRTFDDIHKECLKWIPDNKKHLYTKEICSLQYKEPLEELEKRLEISIDEGFSHTIDWILENLYVADCDHQCVRNREGRVLKLLGWDEEDYVVDDNGNKIEE